MEKQNGDELISSGRSSHIFIVVPLCEDKINSNFSSDCCVLTSTLWRRIVLISVCNLIGGVTFGFHDEQGPQCSSQN